MAITDGYTTKAIIKARLNITGTAQDAAIDDVILAASREIDGWTGQTFAKDATDTIRYVTARFDDVITVPPMVTLTALAVDRGNDLYDTAWATTDYVLHPRNAAATSEPFTEIRRAFNGRYAFPVDLPFAVRVTGIFGWPSVPVAIAQACALQASRLWARTLAPLGLAGSGEFGLTAIATVDPDVKVLLAPFRVLAV
jgi:hypothetical protein